MPALLRFQALVNVELILKWLVLVGKLLLLSQGPTLPSFLQLQELELAMGAVGTVRSLSPGLSLLTLLIPALPCPGTS